ncbi:MAG: penicillin-binding protein 2 [Candidatus Moranbacteria bacterium]|nr:penicillin-binding protein 2 [Candidatus Moranbacteria bacterium]
MKKGVKYIQDLRVYLLFFFVLAVSFFVLARLYFLQIAAHEKYKMIADGQYKVFKELESERGSVFMNDKKKSYPLAINRDLQMAYAVPREIDDVNVFANEIGSILGMEKNVILDKIADKDDVFEVLKRKLTDEEVDKINELKFTGIHLAPESYRYYPAGRLASQIVGFVGWDNNSFSGRYGVESFWDSELKGKSGMISQEKDAGGRWISLVERDFQPAVDGVDLFLTIDYAVQYETEKILESAIKRHQADNGSILVMEPKTGRILSMASYPNFDPNEYWNVEDMKHYINPVVSGTYESGSVLKPITMAIGIDEGKVEPDSTYVDTGVVYEAGYEIKNSDEKAYGLQTMTQVLEESLNTGVIHVEKLVGNKKFANYIKRFGFGEESGIELPGESAGNISNLEHLNRNIEFFTASYGQGLTMTPLQLTNAYATIANGGKFMKPQIIDKIVYSNGETKEIRPQEIRRVIREDTAKKVSKMLRSVVVNGHGKKADVPGYLVGGKTGTAQVAKKNEKGYEEGVAIGSFVGFAPINDPQFVVCVKISNPKDVLWAESSAAPTFGEVMEFLLEYYGIEPTEPINASE